MGIGTAAIVAAGIGAAGTVAGSAIAAGGANKRARRARSRERELQTKLENLEKTRQEIINPFEGVTSLSGMISDTSSILSNTYNNLGVATQAAEFQAEEADIALANTLDALQASGASAGGATALAQAALQSKRGVSANIEQQEANNQKLRAKGEQSLQMARFGEAQRVQSAQLGEARRLQQADVAGREFVYGEKERREGEQLNRIQAQITGQQQQAVAERQNATAAFGAGISSVGNIASSLASNASLGQAQPTSNTFIGGE